MYHCLLETGLIPRQGAQSDQTHLPIHSNKYLNKNLANENEQKLYDLIVRHFLACVSQDAKVGGF